MSGCCKADAEKTNEVKLHSEAAPWVFDAGADLSRMDLIVPDIHCAGCIARIERTLSEIPGVTSARVNLGSKRLAVEWQDGTTDADTLTAQVRGLGYTVQPFDKGQLANDANEEHGKILLRSIAVAGFAAGNIMLLSVSVWSGAEAATKDLFHWISALIAIPAVAYAGRPFFFSALRALSAKSLNMDVPISLAVLLATGMSVVETFIRGPNAYFDAAVTLLLFLLIGRYLDHMTRTRAHSVAGNLLALNATGATVVEEDGSHRLVALEAVKPGMKIAVAAGEKVPVDGTILTGMSDFDLSLVTGESVPASLTAGADVHAGTVNISGPVVICVTAVGDDTLLSEIVRLMEDAEQGRAKYMRIADRAARIYAPAVHLAALLTFIGWMIWSGGDWHLSLLTAIAVLIITCPCALGLAVPAVQVVANARLLKAGILVKDGTGLERLGEIDHVVFDKTGTLTFGEPRLVSTPDKGLLGIAAGLGNGSAHPLSKAVVEVAKQEGFALANVTDIREHPGLGLEGTFKDDKVRLGNAAWCGARAATHQQDRYIDLWLKVGDGQPVSFEFDDQLRPDARAVVQDFESRGIQVELLSGDRGPIAARIAKEAGIEHVHSGRKPADKVAHIEALAREGHKVLMVGDGLNDAPALAAAHVSMSPGSAVDISRNTASFIFLRSSLLPVMEAYDTARRADRLVRQNFSLAILYNMIAVPIAVAGFATPLVAAIAMSSSSLVVTLNALRLGRIKARTRVKRPAQPTKLDSGKPATGIT